MKKKLKSIWLFTVIASLSVLSFACSDPIGNVSSTNVNEKEITLILGQNGIGQCVLTNPRAEYTITIVTVDFPGGNINSPVLGTTYKGFSPKTGFLPKPIGQGDNGNLLVLNNFKVPSKGAWAILVEVRTDCDECANRYNGGCNQPQRGKANFSTVYTVAPDNQPTNGGVYLEPTFSSAICGC